MAWEPSLRGIITIATIPVAAIIASTVYLRSRRNHQRRLKIQATELRNRRDKLTSLRISLQNNIDNSVKTNKSNKPEINISNLSNINTKMESQFKEYLDDFRIYSDWRRASEQLLNYRLEEILGRYLPWESVKASILETLNTSINIVPNLLNGKDNTAIWIKENFPIEYKDILKCMFVDQESESRFDEMCLDLDQFANFNPSILIYREEKKKLIEKGTKLINGLDNEINSIEAVLKEYGMKNR